MNALANLRIAAKLSVIPVSIIALLIGLGVYGYVLQTQNEQKLANLSAGIMRQSAMAADFDQEAWESLTRLYRLVSLAANETDEQKITAIAKETGGDLKSWSGKFADQVASHFRLLDWQPQQCGPEDNVKKQVATKPRDSRENMQPLNHQKQREKQRKLQTFRNHS